ncbi:MAG: prepilin-type N-terminal cleavage/methylation domain-containing protein [Phycisphaerales bacterium]|nr:prepilin-type N-terminal cleavage/methylation domain-containing protein [Phycisphaerales bacterium]
MISTIGVRKRGSSSSGFTLVELLVVISIIALLISILLPSLKKARDSAKAVKCAANLKSVGVGVATYLAENNGVYPPSYVYPNDAAGSWNLRDGGQNTTSVPFGYMHWSYFLYSNGKVGDEAFQCPSFTNGGAPRTNPGLESRNWESGQIDAGHNNNPNELVDKQATRMAYAANAAIMPRNKFTPLLSGGQRRNVLVQENRIKRPGSTILATEYLENWKALGVPESGSLVLVKSHRPINVFYHLGSSYNEYEAPESSPGFIYGEVGNAKSPEQYGLLRLGKVKDKTNILDYTSGVPQINAVGRSHPGGTDKAYGGTANFMFTDTHVDRMTAFQTMRNRLWGDRYYSLSGENQIINMDAPQD